MRRAFPLRLSATMLLRRRWIGGLAPTASPSSSSLLTFGLAAQRRAQSDLGNFDDEDSLLRDVMDQGAAADTPLDAPLGTPEISLTQKLAAASEVDVVLEKLPRAPAQYDVLHQTSVYRWQTTAKYGRKISGPMREWADEFQCRTGVHVTMEPRYPDKAQAGGYATGDDVEVDVFFFGADKAVEDAKPLVKAMTALQPAYVRCAVYRKTDDGGVEWLMLRRINRERRPADIPPVSLKTPGKYTMLFENVEEAVLRSVYEETGVELERKQIIKTNVFDVAPSMYFWRPSVHYYVAELPQDATLLGPQVTPRSYMTDWDNRLLRQSADAIDRAWATHADPKTGIAWLKAPLIDELQKPVKLEDNYMSRRYLPSPETGLQDLFGFHKTEAQDAAPPAA